MKKSFAVLAAIASISARAGLPNVVYWDFLSSAAPASNSFSGLTVGDFARQNGGSAALLTGTSASSGYTTALGFSASGGTNAVAGAHAGALSTSSSSYFSTALSLSASVGYSLTATNISFGSRSTASGPVLLSLYASSDGFVSDFQALGSLSVSPDSAWAPEQFGGLSLDIAPGGSLSFRLYGSDGSGTSAGNWRVDDFGVALSATPLAVPEPGTFFLLSACGLTCLGLGWGRRGLFNSTSLASRRRGKVH